MDLLSNYCSHRPLEKNFFGLLSNYCSNRPLARLLEAGPLGRRAALPPKTRQGLCHTMLAVEWRQGRGKEMLARAAFQKSPHSARLLSTRSVRWKSEDVRPFLQGGSCREWEQRREPGSENLGYPASHVQTKWEQEEVRAIWPPPRTKTRNLPTLQKNKLKQTKRTIRFLWAVPAWGRGKMVIWLFPLYFSFGSWIETWSSPQTPHQTE